MSLLQKTWGKVAVVLGVLVMCMTLVLSGFVLSRFTTVQPGSIECKNQSIAWGENMIASVVMGRTGLESLAELDTSAARMYFDRAEKMLGENSPPSCNQNLVIAHMDTVQAFALLQEVADDVDSGQMSQVGEKLNEAVRLFKHAGSLVDNE